MAAIEVATFEQLATVLSQLATNYSNLFVDYFNIFYNPEPMDVTIQYYDDEGILQTITIPNRAKDRAYILNGNGSPEGSKSAAKGSIYQDLTNGDAYVKQSTSTDDIGWSKFISASDLEDFLVQGSGSPEGSVTLPKGVLYVDRASAALYMKTTATGNTGWAMISADTSALANRDLSNLTTAGEGHFANLSLNNLNATGQALISGKENSANKIIEFITSGQGANVDNTHYPSAKLAYDTIMNTTNLLANRDLSNLNTEGERRFVGMDQVRDCILEASGGLPSSSGNIITLPAGTILLCANGVTNTNAVNNTRVTLGSALSVSEAYTATDGVLNATVFYNNTSSSLFYIKSSQYFRQIYAPSGFTEMLWYNPSDNTYKHTSDSGTTWTTYSMAEIGRFSTTETGAIDKFYPYHPIVVSTQDEVINKVDKDDLVETIGIMYANKVGTEWIRIWTDGWCEQGGAKAFMSAATLSTQNLSFIYDFIDTTYTLLLSSSDVSGTTVNGVELGWGLKTPSGFKFGLNEGFALDQVLNWYACGFLDMDKFNETL